jgi:hypothetical protein
MVADDGDSRLREEDFGRCHGQPALGSGALLVLVQHAVPCVCTGVAGDFSPDVPSVHLFTTESLFVNLILRDAL